MYGNNYWSYLNGSSALYGDTHFSYPYDVPTIGSRRTQNGQTTYREYGGMGLFCSSTLPPPPPSYPTDNVSISFHADENGPLRTVMEKHSGAQKTFSKIRRRDDATRPVSALEKYVRQQKPNDNHQHRKRRSHQDWYLRYQSTPLEQSILEDKDYDVETMDWDTKEYPRAMTPSFVGSGEPIVAGEKHKEMCATIKSQLSTAQIESISMWELNMGNHQLFTGAISSSNISKGRPAKEIDFKRTFPYKADPNCQWEQGRKIQTSLNLRPDMENIPDMDNSMITVYRTSTKLVRKPMPVTQSKDIEVNSSSVQGSILHAECVDLPSTISPNITLKSASTKPAFELDTDKEMFRLLAKGSPLSPTIPSEDSTNNSNNSVEVIPSKIIFPSAINKGEAGKRLGMWRREQEKEQIPREDKSTLNHLYGRSRSWAINENRIRMINDRDIEWDSDNDITKVVPKKVLVLPEEQKPMNTSSSSSSIDISSDAEILPDSVCCNIQDNDHGNLVLQKTSKSSFSVDLSSQGSPNIGICNSPYLAVPSLSCSVANSPCSTIISPRKEQCSSREETLHVTPSIPSSPVKGAATSLQSSFPVGSNPGKQKSKKSNLIRPGSGNDYEVPATIKTKSFPVNSRPSRGLMSLRIINGKRVAGDSRECFANLRGKCMAGIFCRFEHEGSTIHQNKKVCSRLLRGLCRPDADCSHHVLLPHQYPVCQFFLRICCFEPDCQLLHVKHSCNLQPCEDFNKGLCLEGDNCDYPHRYIYQTVKKRGIHIHEEEVHRSDVADVDEDDVTTLQWIT